MCWNVVACLQCSVHCIVFGHCVLELHHHSRRKVWPVHDAEG